MNTRQMILAVMVVVLAGVAVWYIRDNKADEGPEPEKFMRGSEEWVRYRDPDIGLYFEYRKNPDGYSVINQDESLLGLETVREFLTIINTRELEELLHATTSREAPPTISILVADNPTATTSRAWAESNKLVSGIDRALSDIIELQFSGTSAIRYISDGLYANDTIVTATGTKVYVIVGSLIQEDSPIRRDFLNMLQYFLFI